MLQTVVRTAEMAGLGPVIVLTGDPEIERAMADWTGRVARVEGNFLNGSERVAAALTAGVVGPPFPKVVVNLQGDAVGATPDLLRKAAVVLKQKAEAELATVAVRSRGEESGNRTTVTQKSGRAVDFSRKQLSPGTEPVDVCGVHEPLLHVGIYAYRTQALLEIAQKPPSAREQQESLEQLRWIDYGRHVALHVDSGPPELAHAIDRPSDLQQNLEGLRGGFRV